MQWWSSQFPVLIAFSVALPCLVDGRSFGLRGESSKAPQEDDTIVARLEADNEVLMKRNEHLEAMVQVARAEVQKMDLMRKQEAPKTVANEQVLNQEIADLKNKLAGVEAEKKDLVQTLRHMLTTNASRAFQKQAQKAQEMKFALELKCGQERAGLENQLKESQVTLQKKMEEATGKCDDAKELAQTLQEQNLDLQKKVRDLQAQLAKSDRKDAELTADKANLVATMNSLMHESASFKGELEKQKAMQAKEEKDLATDEAKLAKLMPKPKPNSKIKHVRRNVTYTFSHNHKESTASQLAHMEAINHYIVRSQEPSEDVGDDDDASAPQVTSSETLQEVAPASSAESKGWQTVGKQMDEVQQQVVKVRAEVPIRHEEQHNIAATATTVPSKAEEGLAEWLGMKAATGNVPKDANGLSPIDALDPAVVKQQEKKIELQKKHVKASKSPGESDDGGDGIEELLKQAKAQLKAMDDTSAGSAASDSVP